MATTAAPTFTPTLTLAAGDGYRGTFLRLARTLVADVLTDGPVTARITFEEHGRPVEHTGTLEDTWTGTNTTYIYLDGQAWDLADLDSIQV